MMLTSSPFTALAGAISTIYLNPDEYRYRVTVGGSLGFQGYTTFQANLLGNYVLTFDTECLIQTPGTAFASCDKLPVGAELYFPGDVFKTT
jgi:hypothetical protein